MLVPVFPCPTTCSLCPPWWGWAWAWWSWPLAMTMMTIVNLMVVSMSAPSWWNWANYLCVTKRRLFNPAIESRVILNERTLLSSIESLTESRRPHLFPLKKGQKLIMIYFWTNYRFSHYKNMQQMYIMKNSISFNNLTSISGRWKQAGLKMNMHTYWIGLFLFRSLSIFLLTCPQKGQRCKKRWTWWTNSS